MVQQGWSPPCLILLFPSTGLGGGSSMTPLPQASCWGCPICSDAALTSLGPRVCPGQLIRGTGTVSSPFHWPPLTIRDPREPTLPTARAYTETNSSHWRQPALGSPPALLLSRVPVPRPTTSPHHGGEGHHPHGQAWPSLSPAPSLGACLCSPRTPVRRSCPTTAQAARAAASAPGLRLPGASGHSQAQAHSQLCRWPLPVPRTGLGTGAWRGRQCR